MRETLSESLDYQIIKTDKTDKMDEKINLLSCITSNADICHGKPIIRGLRYPVQNMLELLASGRGHKEILADYKNLEEADLQACLLFASCT